VYFANIEVLLTLFFELDDIYVLSKLPVEYVKADNYIQFGYTITMKEGLRGKFFF
jgi:hypothetical protein